MCHDKSGAPWTDAPHQAESTTGDKLCCIYIEDARDMVRLLDRAKEVLTICGINDVLGIGADELVADIESYLRKVEHLYY